MEKHISFAELRGIFYNHNCKLRDEKIGYYEKPIEAVIVYKESNWPGYNYSLEARSYKVSSDNYGFEPGKISNSIAGSSLDGDEHGVRLDCYNWEVDYCYILEGESK